jgi:hypothetical protein
VPVKCAVRRIVRIFPTVMESRYCTSGGIASAGPDQESGMKRMTLLFVFVLGAAVVLQAESRWSFKGTVIRMRMADCVAQGGFKASLSGISVAGGSCPEYTVMSSKVVYVVVGRRTEEFIPLAEDMDFLIRKNEVVIFSNDEKVRSRFVIQQMTLRADWDREQEQKELETRMMERSVNYEVRNRPRGASVSASAR